MRRPCPAAISPGPLGRAFYRCVLSGEGRGGSARRQPTAGAARAFLARQGQGPAGSPAGMMECWVPLFGAPLAEGGRRQGLCTPPLSISARVFSCRSMNHPRRGPSLLQPPAQATSPPPLQPSCLHPQKTRLPAPYPLPPPQSTTRPATARLHQILTNGTSKPLKQNNKKHKPKQNKKAPSEQTNTLFKDSKNNEHFEIRI